MERTYLLHFTIGGKPSRTRISEAATDIKSLLRELSPDHKLAYSSGDGTTFGFFVKSELRAPQLAWRIYSPGGEGHRAPIVPSPLRTDDRFLVLEIGSEASGVMDTKIEAWLRFHRPSPSQEAKSSTAAAESKAPSQLASQLEAIKGKLGTGGKK